MPELIEEISASTANNSNGISNGGIVDINITTENALYLSAKENDYSREWDPTNLLNKLYIVDYNPFVEKRNRFRNMEGHLEVPNDEPNLIPEIEKEWKKLYFRTKDGRFQWFATHFADEHPIEDVLLNGTTITATRNDWTITIKGGKENANLIVKTPSNLFVKWHQALLSHSHSKLIDAYVQPVYPPVPHYTNKIVLIELGTCSIRAGVLSNKPSLPQVFLPSVCCALNNGKIAVGIDAFQPSNRLNGKLQSPIQLIDSKNGSKRYQINQQLLSVCLQKVLHDLRLDPNQYKVLFSIPQNVPSTAACDLLRILLQEFCFKAASIARQPSLILYSYDVTTGVVVDIGESLNIVPVIDEYIVEDAIISLPFGAQQIRHCLQEEFSSRNQQFPHSAHSAIEQIVLRYIAEQSCYVAVDFEEETKNGTETKEVNFEKFNLGNGMEPNVNVDSLRFNATEGLFKPKRWKLVMNGLHHLIHTAIQQSPIDSRRILYRNIYLSGGTSLLVGLAERLETEISKIVPSSIFVQVHGSPWRYHASYLGSQVIANSLQFENCCANLSNLDEYIQRIQKSNF